MTDPISFPDTTPRFALPMLYAGQAQKEVTINEGLTLADLLMHCRVQEERADPPANPVAGQAWLVATGATGDWQGEESALAGWTDGGWRFIAPQAGMRVYDEALAAYRHYDGGWTVATAPALPSGGTVVDSEARQMLADLVTSLRTAGVFPTT